MSVSFRNKEIGDNAKWKKILSSVGMEIEEPHEAKEDSLVGGAGTHTYYWRMQDGTTYQSINQSIKQFFAYYLQN